MQTGVCACLCVQLAGAAGGITRVSHGREPLLLYNGQVTALNRSAKIVSILLATHRYQNDERVQLNSLPDPEVRVHSLDYMLLTLSTHNLSVSLNAQFVDVFTCT